MQQVRRVCAEAGPGRMPDIPDFLRRTPDNSGGAKDWEKATPAQIWAEMQGTHHCAPSSAGAQR